MNLRYPGLATFRPIYLLKFDNRKSIGLAIRKGRSVALAITYLLLSGCGKNPLLDAINAAFPPVDRTEQEIAAVDTSRSTLGELKGQNILISLGVDDIRSMAVDAISKKLPQLSQAKLTFGRQRISIEANFDTN
jgi:hypothetical protein